MPRLSYETRLIFCVVLVAIVCSVQLLMHQVWNTDGALLHTVSDHKGEVTAVAAHVTNNYFVTAGRDKAWGFYDIQQGVCLRQVTGEAFEGGYECARFHPDGLILATGTNDAQVNRPIHYYILAYSIVHMSAV
jgi:WD40 repeat protein